MVAAMLGLRGDLEILQAIIRLVLVLVMDDHARRCPGNYAMFIDASVGASSSADNVACWGQLLHVFGNTQGIYGPGSAARLGLPEHRGNTHVSKGRRGRVNAASAAAARTTKAIFMRALPPGRGGAVAEFRSRDHSACPWPLARSGSNRPYLPRTCQAPATEAYASTS